MHQKFRAHHSLTISYVLALPRHVTPIEILLLLRSGPQPYSPQCREDWRAESHGLSGRHLCAHIDSLKTRASTSGSTSNPNGRISLCLDVCGLGRGCPRAEARPVSCADLRSDQ